MHKDPTTTPTEVHSAAGDMSAVAGGYKYFYTEIHRDSGDGIHNCHETDPSPVSTITGDFASKQVVLTLPATGVNGFTTHLKIYGTEDGTDIYYYLGNVELATTTFTDNNITRDVTVAWGKLTTAADGTITQTDLNQPVLNHRYLVATKERIIVCGSEDKDDGTCNFTNASTTVDNGSGTLWTRAIVGCFIQKEGDTRMYQIDSWTDAGELELTQAYAGTTEAGATYKIIMLRGFFRWTAKHPTTAAPMWWAFPTDFYRRIVSKDDSKEMGINKIGNQPVIFKEHSHYLLTENGDDYIVQESRTKVGTCSHWSIAETSELGSLMFVTYEGLIYETTGLQATDWDIDLSKTVDGINKTRLGLVQGRWLDDLKWYILIYSSEGSSAHDRILIVDYTLKEWVILAIYSNCIAIIESSENGQTVFKPWIGTVGGFVYKMLTGNSLGSGSTGTLSGTITAAEDTYIDDSAATFYTTGDGHKDVYVSIFDTDGVFQEEQKITANTATRLNVAAWDTTPTVGWSYEIGSIRWRWKSKVFDLGSDASKSIDTVLLNFKKVGTERNVDVKIYLSEDPDMPSSEDQTVTFDLSQDYYEALGCLDSRARYFQYEICGHGVNAPVTINNIAIAVSENLA